MGTKVTPSSSSSDDEGSVDPADALFQRGSYLRSLRELERQDEAERHQHHPPSASTSIGANEDAITLFSSKKSANTNDINGELVQVRLLQYDRYLQHQRYYDDLKHVDCPYIEYTVLASSSSNPNNDNDAADTHEESSTSFSPPPARLPLIVEQDKSLGKGGLCWDAAFILAEYLAARHSGEWLQQHNNHNGTSTNRPMRILELGAGTGLCGLYLAKHLSFGLSNSNSNNNNNIEIALTDLPQLLPLLQRNVDRNFATSLRLHDNTDPTATTEKETLVQKYLAATTAGSPGDTSHPCGCKVTASILPWGDLSSETQHGEFDVVLGADVVASLYDPVALAQCLHRMLRSDDQNNVYIAYKERWSTRHRQFEAELARWFETVTVVDLLPASSSSSSLPCRNRNPDVKILVAQGKRNEPRD